MSDVVTGAPAPAASTPVDAATPPSEGQIDQQASTNEAPKAEPKKEPAKPASTKKKFNVKVDGKDEDLELDLSNEEELKRHLQMSRAAQKRMQEAAEMRKGVQELIEALRTDPAKVLSDPRLQIPDEVRKKLAQAIIDDELQEMSKTPEQKEKERLQKEYEKLRKQVEEEKTAREKAEFARLQEQQAVALDNEISQAIEGSGLPKNARTVRYFAEALMFALTNNIDLTAKDLVPFVKKQALGEFREIISALPDDDFESWLGKDQISRIRKRNLARAKAAPSAEQIKPTGADVKKSDEEAPKKIPMRDFLKSLGK